MSELPKTYVNGMRGIVVIKEMDDYYLRNAFNYFGRTMHNILGDIKHLTNTNVMHLDVELRGPHMDEVYDLIERKAKVQSIIDALGVEASSRGTMSECDNCKGTGKISERSPCLICIGTGWTLKGVKKYGVSRVARYIKEEQ